MDEARREAEHFIHFEKEFHLGALPTEQSHPKTRGLAEATAADTRKGIAMLQAVDEDIVAAAERAFAGREFGALVETMASALAAGKRVCFSGCGATGRLSILLEAAYRAFWRDARAALGGALVVPGATRPEDSVVSIMTGGDYALVRSVESFEDYMTFGRQQAIEAGIGAGDVLVAITEGGETSSVIGTAWQALEAGASVFFACNNPMGVLAAHVERSRKVIEEPRIGKLDLSSGPMAVAGSTRMQATSSELLVIGAALEMALEQWLRAALPAGVHAGIGLVETTPGDCTARFAALLRDLASADTVGAMAKWVEMEEAIYRDRGAVTYFGGEFLLDIFTDTTERAPTFSLPPFRKCDDTQALRPLAFVKHPARSTAETWRRMLGREPRCLTWEPALYHRMGAAERIRRNPPALNRTELFKFLIGNEDDPSRRSGPMDCAALVLVGAEAAPGGRDTGLCKAFASAASRFPRRALLAVGHERPAPGFDGHVTHVPCALPPSPIRLWDHLAIKLALNTISTATAARLGRVVSNWMAFVETTNKKLVDRGTRLVAELSGLDYATACYELHKSRAELARTPVSGGERLSPVAITLERLRKQKKAGR